MSESEVGEDQWPDRRTPLVLGGAPFLEYQPIVDLASGGLLGYEALLRWRHPTEGLILPQLLIPWAEANGDIVPLGEWVVAQACLHAQVWPRSVQIAVNCSIVQLRKGCGSTAVEQALNSSGMDPDRLTVEITEHAMSDERAIVDLRRISDMGVQLAVDDVGTSWNTFDLLRKMNINTVKIDGSFVAGLEAREGINRMVVETVVHLAQSAGMATVAEGVETALHAAIVREFDTDAGQGYFFAAPLSVENATQLAVIPNYRFPLDGPGWMKAEGWTEIEGWKSSESLDIEARDLSLEAKDAGERSGFDGPDDDHEDQSVIKYPRRSEEARTSKSTSPTKPGSPRGTTVSKKGTGSQSQKGSDNPSASSESHDDLSSESPLEGQPADQTSAASTPTAPMSKKASGSAKRPSGGTARRSSGTAKRPSNTAKRPSGTTKRPPRTSK